MERLSVNQRIAQAATEQWEKLDLSVMHLSELPHEIVQLSNLASLNLNGNQLTALPESIVQLGNLASLNLNGNQLTALPESIVQLGNLASLYLNGNQLTALPESIGQLSNLTSLNLHGNQLTALPESIGQLSNLTSLNLNGNRLTALPESIGQLVNLMSLDLSGTRLTALPESIGQLSNLTSLNLSFNQFTTLPESIGQLNNLTFLNLRRNLLKTLPEWIGQLNNLASLNLISNLLKTLPEWIGQLNNLTSLNLKNNQLAALPESIGQLSNLVELIIDQNPLPQIPPEVVKKGGLAVRDYYRQRLEESTDYIYEAKLLIIGEGGAGKTSLANKLLNPEYKLKLEGGDDPEKSTEGIDVFHFDFPHVNSNSFRVNIWDFGGQEIYHATHQFFLTKRSLYLLVADTRQDNTDFNYWLEVVELLSDASPVLIIKNEKQNRPCQVNENQLRGRFPNLEKILPTNLFDNRGLPGILTAVKHHISQLPHIGQPLPKTWVNVRTTLEADTSNYITQNEFLDLCDTHGFKRHEDKLQLSGYLHDLGVCLHFQEDDLLQRYVILKPEWGTTAVYKVLDTPKVRQSLGCFTSEDLKIIWADEQYASMRPELLQLMKNFKLCYEIPNRPRTYIAPQLLSPNQPEYDWDDTKNLILRYHYEFMPKGMVTRFIVEMHKMIDEGLVWKDGVILSNSKTRAEVIEAYYKNEIRIRVSGFLKKDLLTSIRHEFNKIHDSYEKLRYQELIPCNCPTCKGSQNPHAYELNKLHKRLEYHTDTIECDNPPYHKVNVRSLIDDVTGDSHTSESSPSDVANIRTRRNPTPSNQPIINSNTPTNPNESTPTQAAPAQPSQTVVKTILVLAANPQGTNPLRLGEEVRAIQTGLERSKCRDRFRIEQRWAVTAADIRHALLDHQPQIVHFCGHGIGVESPSDTESASSSRKLTLVSEADSKPEGLVFEDKTGQSHLISSEAIARLFSLFADQINCVLLNACYSATQADAIVKHIPFVVGMKRAIGDRAAIEFARGFYDALFAGRDVESAFKLGRSAIQMEGIPEHLTPILKRKATQPLA
jgi:internalin A